jgi:phosphate transport system protein
MAAMRTEYHAALENAKQAVVRFGALADDAIRCSVRAMERKDAALAERVISGAPEIETMRRALEADCMELIWRQQPVAGELRQIAGILQISTDAERLYSYAVETAKAAVKLAAVAVRPAALELANLAGIAETMVTDALHAYRDGLTELADAVIGREGDLDEAYQHGIKALEEQMQADPGAISPGAVTLLVLANIERMGDRAQNIAWKTKDIYAT